MNDLEAVGGFENYQITLYDKVRAAAEEKLRHVSGMHLINFESQLRASGENVYGLKDGLTGLVTGERKYLTGANVEAVQDFIEFTWDSILEKFSAPSTQQSLKLLLRASEESDKIIEARQAA